MPKRKNCSEQEHRYIFTADFGTTNVRTAFVRDDGKLTGYSKRPYKTYYPASGMAEQVPAEWWQAFLETARRTAEKSQIDAKKCLGITITHTASTIVPCHNGKPLSNAIMWMDTRAAKQSKIINKTKHKDLKWCGGIASAEWGIPKSMWIKNNQPEIWKKANQIFEAADWINYQLSGQITAQRCAAVSKWNVTPKGWPIDLLKKIQLKELLEKIPSQISKLGQPISHLKKSIAKQIGLPVNLPVYQGAVDGHLGLLGMGIVEPGKMGLILGTSAAYFLFQNKAVKNNGFWGPYPEPLIEKLYLLEGGCSSAGSVVNWMKNSFFPGESIKTFDAEGESITPGESGLLINPDFMGNRTPLRDPSIRGSLHGISLHHTRAHIARATYEALAFHTRMNMEAMIADGTAVEEIIACGGGTKSKLWLQTIADVCQIPVTIPKNASRTPLVGGAMAGFMGSGFYDSWQEASKKLNGNLYQIEPNNNNKKKYNKLYADFICVTNNS